MKRANQLGALLVLILTAGGATSEEKGLRNALFDELINQGVVFDGHQRIRLPGPMMREGLNGAGQVQVIEKLVEGTYRVEDFVEDSATAPYLMKTYRAGAAGASCPVYGINLYFTAHGKWERLQEKAFLEGFKKKQKQQKLHLLTADELRERNIPAASDGKSEDHYSHSVVEILERVEVATTMHVVLSQDQKCLVSANMVDHRFQNDRQFPCSWRTMTKDGMGGYILGLPHLYPGGGSYVRITRLQEPAGALFVELHIVYAEPDGWFNGTDPLRSKLHTPIQEQVRSFRRQLKAAQ